MSLALLMGEERRSHSWAAGDPMLNEMRLGGFATVWPLRGRPWAVVKEALRAAPMLSS